MGGVIFHTYFNSTVVILTCGKDNSSLKIVCISVFVIEQSEGFVKYHITCKTSYYIISMRKTQM